MLSQIYERNLKKIMYKFLKEIFKRFYINKKIRSSMKNISIILIYVCDDCVMHLRDMRNFTSSSTLICSHVRKPELYK